METKDFHLVIVSPEQTLFDGKAESVVLPGEQGAFQILVNHAALISLLAAGDVKYVAGNELHTLRIAGGFVEVKNNQVSVCAEL